MNTVCALLLLLYSSAYAQQATEVFIPIGSSPGVSGVHSITGVIERAFGSIFLRVGDHLVLLLPNERTVVYLEDEPRNRVIEIRDIKHGMQAEVLTARDDAGTSEIEDIGWIKVRGNRR